MTELTLHQHKNTLQVTLAPSDYDPTGVALIKQLLSADGFYLAGTATANEDGTLTIDYAVPAQMESLSAFAPHASLTERLMAAQQLLRLGDYQQQQVIPYLTPANIFLANSDLRVAHRGIESVMAPDQVDAQEYFARLRALVIVTLRPNLDFEAVITGAAASDNKLTKKLAAADSVAALRKVLTQATAEASEGKAIVPSSRYQGFKWSAIVAGVLTVALAAVLVYQLGFAVPRQQRMVAALGDFAGGNYQGTTRVLSQDDPRKLTASTQYALAVSYVRQDNLSTKQQNTITNALSPKTTTNTLLYWTYLGRGQFNQALNLAKNVGDNQMILYAYSKLYDATEADNTLSGAKKQHLLNSYQRNIKSYKKKIGGK